MGVDILGIELIYLIDVGSSDFFRTKGHDFDGNEQLNARHKSDLRVKLHLR